MHNIKKVNDVQIAKQRYISKASMPGRFQK